MGDGEMGAIGEQSDGYTVERRQTGDVTAVTNMRVG